jgi:signal transduction histidine kinase
MRMNQVVTNLLTNALKYGAQEPVTMTVKPEDGWAILTVSDSGIGIAEDKVGRIFERFERAIDHSNISGLGLGLYITRQIVDRHEGKIKVRSEPGKGSSFEVRLPLRQ